MSITDRLTFDRPVGELRRGDIGVRSTVTLDRRPHSVGVVCGIVAGIGPVRVP